MKITFNVDCTPQEARAFFGLPEIAPMQERLLAEMEAAMRKNMPAYFSQMGFDKFFQDFLSGAGTGMERWQEFFQQMTGTGSKPG